MLEADRQGHSTVFGAAARRFIAGHRVVFAVPPHGQRLWPEVRGDPRGNRARAPERQARVDFDGARVVGVAVDLDAAVDGFLAEKQGADASSDRADDEQVARSLARLVWGAAASWHQRLGFPPHGLPEVPDGQLALFTDDQDAIHKWHKESGNYIFHCVAAMDMFGKIYGSERPTGMTRVPASHPLDERQLLTVGVLSALTRGELGTMVRGLLTPARLANHATREGYGFTVAGPGESYTVPGTKRAFDQAALLNDLDEVLVEGGRQAVRTRAYDHKFAHAPGRSDSSGEEAWIRYAALLKATGSAPNQPKIYWSRHAADIQARYPKAHPIVIRVTAALMTMANFGSEVLVGIDPSAGEQDRMLTTLAEDFLNDSEAREG